MSTDVNAPGGDKPAGTPLHDRPSSFSLDAEQRTIAVAIRSYWDRMRSGDPGALPGESDFSLCFHTTALTPN